MAEKNYEEYCNLLQMKKEWGSQCDICSQTIDELSQKIRLLTDTGQHISSNAVDIRALVSQIPELPYLYPEWTGYHAERCYGSCETGELAEAYCDYGKTLDNVLQTIETERNRLSLELEKTNSTYLNAKSNYVYWTNRAAYYWK